MEKSESIEKLAAALSKAQGDFSTPPKNNKVKYKQTEYWFSNLATIIEHNKRPMTDNGLAITQLLDYSGDNFGLLTVLTHASGQWLSSFHPLPDSTKMPPQDFGSKLTYARRYSYQTIQGIEAEKDDDGALAQAEYKQTPPRGNAPRPRAHQDKPVQNYAPTSRALNQAEIESTWAHLSTAYNLRGDEVKYLCKTLYNRPGLGKITKEDAKDLLARLSKEGPQLLESLANSETKQ